MAKRGRPRLDTARIEARMRVNLHGVMDADARAKGYTNSSGGVLWGEYLGAIALLIFSGKLDVPKKD